MARDAAALKLSRFIGRPRPPGLEDTVELVEQRHQPLSNIAAGDLGFRAGQAAQLHGGWRIQVHDIDEPGAGRLEMPP